MVPGIVVLTFLGGIVARV